VIKAALQLFSGVEHGRLSGISERLWSNEHWVHIRERWSIGLSYELADGMHGMQQIVVCVCG